MVESRDDQSEVRSGAALGVPARVSLTCESIDEVEDQAARLDWRVGFTQLEKGRFIGRHDLWNRAGLLVTRESYARKIHVVGKAPSERITIILPARESGLVTLDGEPVPPGGLVVLKPGQGIEITTFAAVEITTLQFGRPLLDRAAEGVLGQGATEVLLRRVVLVPPASAIDSLGARLFEWPPPESSRPGSGAPAEAGLELARSVADALVVAIMGGLNPAFTQRARGLERAAIVARRARNFLEANLNRSVSRAEICAASEAPLRSLHHSFGRCYGTSPIAYHRYRRLKQVHEQLKREHPALLSVTEAATSWGFDHLGRFAADYKSIYGECPSVTLGRVVDRAATKIGSNEGHA